MTTYDAAAFQEMLNDLATRVGELRGLDLSLEMLRKSDDDYLREASPTGTSARVPFEVTLGSTHPFTYSPLVGNANSAARAQAIVSRLSELSEQGATWGQTEIGSLMTRLTYLTGPDAEEIASIAGKLEKQVSLPLGTALIDNFASVELGDFEGAAANAFGLFYDQVVEISKNQAKLAADVGNGIAAAGQVLTMAQHSVMGAVDSSLDGVEKQLRQRQADHASTASLDLKDFLSLAALATGLFALVPGVGNGAKVVKELVAYAGREVPAGSRETISVVARDAEDLMASLNRSVTRVLEHTDDNWAELDNSYVKDILGAAGPLRTPDVGIDQHRGPGDFHDGDEAY